LGKLNKDYEQRLKKQIDNIPAKLAAKRAETEEHFAQQAREKTEIFAEKHRKQIEKEAAMKRVFPSYPDKDGL
jgi:uncharacterized membrane-anchored protein YhcB (DUF1043 family)